MSNSITRGISANERFRLARSPLMYLISLQLNHIRAMGNEFQMCKTKTFQPDCFIYSWQARNVCEAYNVETWKPAANCAGPTYKKGMTMGPRSGWLENYEPLLLGTITNTTG